MRISQAFRKLKLRSGIKKLGAILLIGLSATCSPAQANNCDTFNILMSPESVEGSPEQILSFKVVRDLQLLFHEVLASPDDSTCTIDLKLSVSEGGSTKVELQSQEAKPKIDETLDFGRFHAPTVTRAVIERLSDHSDRLAALKESKPGNSVSMLEELCDWATAPEVTAPKDFLAELEAATSQGIVFGHEYDSSSGLCNSPECTTLLKYAGTVYFRYSTEYHEARSFVGSRSESDRRIGQALLGDNRGGYYRVIPKSDGQYAPSSYVYEGNSVTAVNVLDKKQLWLSGSFPEVMVTKLILLNGTRMLGEFRFVRPTGATRSAFRRVTQCKSVKPGIAWLPGGVFDLQ